MLIFYLSKEILKKHLVKKITFSFPPMDCLTWEACIIGVITLGFTPVKYPYLVFMQLTFLSLLIFQVVTQ